MGSALGLPGLGVWLRGPLLTATALPHLGVLTSPQKVYMQYMLKFRQQIHRYLQDGSKSDTDK